MNNAQRRFIDEYIIDQNATQAAIRAGYSPKTAGAHACRLLKDVNIREEIQRKLNKIAEKAEWTLLDFVRELDEAREVARNEGQASAMVAASTTKAKALGVFIEKQKTEIEGGIVVEVVRFTDEL